MKLNKIVKFMFIPLFVGLLNFGGKKVQNNNVLANDAVSVEESKKEYEIFPIPQEITYEDEATRLTRRVNVFIETGIDIYTKNKLYDVLALKNVKSNNVHNIVENENFNVNIGVYHSDEYVDKLCANIDLSYLDERIDAYYLRIEKRSLTLIGKDTDAVFYGLATLKMIFEQSGESVRELTIKDYSNSKWRGFIEGYYGIPWTSDERIELMHFGEIVKSNVYIYAPKDDSYHSSNWRGLYSERDLAILKEQIQAGLETKTKFAWAIHPFMDGSKPINESNYQEGLEAIINKFNQVYEAGARQFVVSADDISVPEGENGSTFTGYLHRNLLNDLAKWNQEKGDCGDLIFVPTAYYYGDATTHLTNYLSTLVENLDPSISIMWTGDLICSSVKTGRFDYFKEATGREPFMWLNWPVNDYSQSHVLMGKGEVLNDNYLDRDIDFSGIVTNPMPEAEPSKLSIFAICDYTWNIHQFDMDKSYKASFKYLEKNTPDSLYEICQHLSNASKYEGKYFEEGVELAKLINNYNYAVENNDNVDKRIDKLNAYFDKLINCCDDFLNNGYNKKLIKRLSSWVKMISDMASASKLYLTMSKDLESYAPDKLRELLNEAEEVYARSFTHEIPVLYRNKVEMWKADAGIVVLKPFMISLRDNVRDEILLKLGDPTGVIYGGFTNGIYEGTLENIVDGDDATYCWFSGQPEEGAFVRIDLEEVKEIHDIRVLSGNANGRDCMSGEIQYSLDAKTYTTIGKLNGEETILDLRTSPIEARFLRLVNKGTGTWVAFKEVSINNLSMDAVNAISYDGFTDGPQRGTTVDAIIDEDEGTYCWFGRATEEAYVKYDLGEEKEIRDIQVLTGNEEGNDTMYGFVEYSTDGVNFTKAGNLTGAKTVVDFRDAPIRARYIRLTNNGTATWVAIRDISINRLSEDEPLVSFEGLTLLNLKQSKLASINDGDLSSYTWFDWHGDVGSYVQLDLRKATQINNVVFYQSCEDVTNDYFRDFSFQYSLDGTNWINIGEDHYLADKDSGVNLELNLDLSSNPINARYIRVVTNIYMDYGVAIREFNVNINL